jgi:hypothetical protein
MEPVTLKAPLHLQSDDSEVNASHFSFVLAAQRESFPTHIPEGPDVHKELFQRQSEP